MIRVKRNAGFSLVEILVGMVIGLLGVIIIMQIFAVAEGQKRTTTSGADAQTNGNFALFTIERDARMAGYGMALTALGCTINMSWNGTPGTLTLSPVVIGDGGTDGSGNALPDTLQLFYSTNSLAGLPELITQSHPQTASVAFLSSNFAAANGDMVVFYEPGKNCALAQVTDVPTNGVNVIHNPSSLWNINNTFVFPPGGYDANATVYDLGSMVNRTYSIDAANNNLQVCEVSANSSCPPNLPIPVTSDIVNLQAQYGKDKGLHAGHVAGDDIVDTWDTCTPASAGCAADTWGMVVAVRIAMLARSGQYEKPTTAGVCTATTAAPAWVGGTMAVPGGLPSCYRYKVFETVVPLRNIIWG